MYIQLQFRKMEWISILQLTNFFFSNWDKRFLSLFFLVVHRNLTSQTSPTQFRTPRFSINPLDGFFISPFHTPLRSHHPAVAWRATVSFFPPFSCAERPDRSTVAPRPRSGPLSALPLLQNFIHPGWKKRKRSKQTNCSWRWTKKEIVSNERER